VSTVDWVLIGIAAFIALLVLGGVAASRRRDQAQRRGLLERLAAADKDLAAARAADRGWDRELMEAAARAVFASRSSQPIRELQLVQVEDRPGTEADQCVFRVVTDSGAHELRLGRRGDAWLEA
jgi:hypothetical protein